ncbi:MAG: glycerol-3-phosphate dehydrogenase [Woeseia sp.]
MSSKVRDFDIVIIGGGINGAGIARDAATRGLTVLLLESKDFGSGTTSWSSRLIHGGLRYLEYGELSLVYESLHERRYLRQIAPHLVAPIAISIPVFSSSKRGMWTLRAGMVAYDLLSLGKRLPRHRMLNREEFLRGTPGVNATDLQGGARYYDAQVTFAERLVLENVVAAANAGADVRNYSPVTGIRIKGGRVRSVEFIDRQTGKREIASAHVVVNAAGPWVDRVLASADAPMPRLMGGTKGSHIVVGPFAGSPHDAFYVEAAADGRPIFIIPWNGQYLIGTTDIRYDDDPAGAAASAAEVEYLLQETNRVFPDARLTINHIHFAYAGIRPLPWRSKGPESAITRRHVIKRHRNAKGLLSVIGGKLTTYRHLAEQVTDQAVKRLGKQASACNTSSEPLPGAVGREEAVEKSRATDLFPDAGRQRLLQIYGGRASEILKLAAEDPLLVEPLDRETTVVAAEIVFCIRNEYARNLVDLLHRRTMLGLSPDLGRSHASAVARIAAVELGWNEYETCQEMAALDTYNARLTVTAQ